MGYEYSTETDSYSKPWTVAQIESLIRTMGNSVKLWGDVMYVETTGTRLWLSVLERGNWNRPPVIEYEFKLTESFKTETARIAFTIN